MKLDQNYLSDEELEALIADIEENDFVSAPPELLNQILHTIEVSELGIKPLTYFEMQKKKTIEFRKYCIQVITSVAAAIVIVFLLPTSMKMQKSELLSIPSKDMILEKQTVKTKSDVLENSSREALKLEDFFKDIELFQIFE